MRSTEVRSRRRPSCAIMAHMSVARVLFSILAVICLSSSRFASATHEHHSTLDSLDAFGTLETFQTLDIHSAKIPNLEPLPVEQRSGVESLPVEPRRGIESLPVEQRRGVEVGEEGLLNSVNHLDSSLLSWHPATSTNEERLRSHSTPVGYLLAKHMKLNERISTLLLRLPDTTSANSCPGGHSNTASLHSNTASPSQLIDDAQSHTSSFPRDVDSLELRFSFNFHSRQRKHSPLPPLPFQILGLALSPAHPFPHAIPRGDSTASPHQNPKKRSTRGILGAPESATQHHRSLLLHKQRDHAIRATLEAQAAPPPLSDEEILAPYSTRRVNPIEGFSIYVYGWNLTSKNYWASLLWSGIPAAFVAAVWVLAGLLLAIIFLSIWCCCKQRRERWKKKEVERSRAFKICLLTLTICSVALCIAGFITACIGQVAMWNQVKSDVDFIVETTQDVTSFVTQVATFLQIAANSSILNMTIPETDRAPIEKAAASAISVSYATEQRALAGQAQANHIIYVVSLVILLVTSLLMLFILLATASAAAKFVVVFFIMMTLMWSFCFFSLCILTASVDAYNFTGDTGTALTQVEENPSLSSAMDYIIPCTNDSLRANVTQQQVRKATYDLVTLLNTAWNSSDVPPIEIDSHNISQICNPFQGPPDYLPATEPCHPNAANLTQIFKKHNATDCIENPDLCPQFADKMQQLEITLVATAAVLQTAYPSLGTLVNCKYVGALASALLEHGQSYRDAAYNSFVGYICLSMGVMILCICLPFVALRLVKSSPLGQQPLSPRLSPAQNNDSDSKELHEVVAQGESEGEHLNPHEDPKSSVQ